MYSENFASVNHYTYAVIDLESANTSTCPQHLIQVQTPAQVESKEKNKRRTIKRPRSGKVSLGHTDSPQFIVCRATYSQLHPDEAVLTRNPSRRNDNQLLTRHYCQVILTMFQWMIRTRNQRTPMRALESWAYRSQSPQLYKLRHSISDIAATKRSFEPHMTHSPASGDL